MSPFQKGHKGYKRKNKPKSPTDNNKKEGNKSLDTYYTSISRFKKLEKGQKYLDPELIDWYINNDLDLTELFKD